MHFRSAKRHCLFLFIINMLMLSACSSVNDTSDIQIRWNSFPQLPGIDHHPNLGVAGAFSGITSHKLVVAGGANFPFKPAIEKGKKKYWDLIYMLSLDQQPPLRWSAYFFHLPYPVAYGAAVTTEQGIVCIGGKNDSGYLSKVIALQWDTAQKRMNIGTLPDLPLPLSGMAATTFNNNIYIAGGENDAGKQDGLYRLSLDNLQSGWKRLSSLPGPSLSDAVLVTQSDGHRICLYLMGGRSAADAKGHTSFYSATWKFDLEKKDWQRMQDIQNNQAEQISLAAGTGTAIGKHYILLFGGDDGLLFNRLAHYQHQAAQASDPEKKQHWQKQYDSLFTHHPGFNKQVFLYNTVTDHWCISDTLPFAVPVTTNLFSYDRQLFLTSGEIRPGIRTPAIHKGIWSLKPAP